MASGISVKLPLTLSQKNGFCELTQNYREMVKQNLKMLILTCGGERIMDASYGVGLRNFLFLENVKSVRNDISTKIYEQVGKYLPFIEIENLQVYGGDEEDSNSNSIKIRMFYRIVPLGEKDLLEMDEKIQ